MRGGGDERVHGEPCQDTQTAYEAGGVKHDGHQHAVDGRLASDVAVHWYGWELSARELSRDSHEIHLVQAAF